MGTYTRFGASFIVKEEYRQAVADMIAAKAIEPWPTWDHLADSVFRLTNDGIMYFNGSGAPPEAPLLLGLRKFLEDERHRWIGFNNLSDHATELNWGNVHEYDPVTGRWDFTCALKNYNHTIELFCEQVLVHLAEQILKLQLEVDPFGGRALFNCQVTEGKFVYAELKKLDPEAEGEERHAFGFGYQHQDDYELLAPDAEFQER